MGIIRKILHRSNSLKLSRFNLFFLDMEENIHIHYRDLRIELSKSEFEDFAKAFSSQSAELLKIIHDRNYQDGNLPNANQEDVRIWTESNLKHSIKYHPTRISIEECTDGYHLHYRNYKILLDEPDFFRLVGAMQSVERKIALFPKYDDFINLLDANDIDYVLIEGNSPPNKLSIGVAQHHKGKINSILNYLKLKGERDGNGNTYTSPSLTIHVRIHVTKSYERYRTTRVNKNTMPLLEYIVNYEVLRDPNLVNTLQCQVIDLYHFIAKQDNRAAMVSTNPDTWLISPEARKIVFPFFPSTETTSDSHETLLREWNAFLRKLSISTTKPRKDVFPIDIQKVLLDKIREEILSSVASSPAVSRIYLLGSAARDELGIYCAPFVCGTLVKLGSDVDILIELDPALEKQIPKEWKLVSNRASDNKCAIYHIKEVALPVSFDHFKQMYPNIAFTHHLIDAYVYFPSRNEEVAKNNWLARFKYRVLHDKEKDGVYQSADLIDISTQIVKVTDLTPTLVTRLPVHTQNELYRISTDNGDYIAKLHIVSGNIDQKHIAKHVRYEHDLIDLACRCGLETARIVSRQNARIKGYPMLVFEEICGDPLTPAPYPLETVTSVLAHFHTMQKEEWSRLDTEFNYESTWDIWSKKFLRQCSDSFFSPAIRSQLENLKVYMDRLMANKPEQGLFASSRRIHLHGDVCPKNFIMRDGKAILFDFNNAIYGPRMIDVIDGAIEFALAEDNKASVNFEVFDTFVEIYNAHAPLTESERRFFTDWILCVGLVKYSKELKMLKENPKNSIRIERAENILNLILSKVRLN